MFQVGNIVISQMNQFSLRICFIFKNVFVTVKHAEIITVVTLTKLLSVFNSKYDANLQTSFILMLTVLNFSTSSFLYVQGTDILTGIFTQ